MWPFAKKVVPRLNKHDDVIEWNFMKTALPEMKSWLRPCLIVMWTASINASHDTNSMGLSMSDTLKRLNCLRPMQCRFKTDVMPNLKSLYLKTVTLWFLCEDVTFWGRLFRLLLCKHTQVHSFESNQWKTVWNSFTVSWKNKILFHFFCVLNKEARFANRRSCTLWKRFVKIHWNIKRFRFVYILQYKISKNISKQVYWLL